MLDGSVNPSIAEIPTSLRDRREGLIPDDALQSLKLYHLCRFSFTRQALDKACGQVVERAMLDTNTKINIVLAFAAVAFAALQFFLAARLRRTRPDLFVHGVDTWSKEKFGVWWIARALIILVTVVLGVGFALFGGSRSIGGTLVLFSYSAVFTFKEFLRDKW